MNKLRWIQKSGIAFMALTLLSWAPPLRAEDGPKTGRREAMEKRNADLAKELGLTPEQQTKMREQRKAHHAEAKRLMKEVENKQQAIAVELEKPQVNTAEVNRLHSELKDLRAKLDDHRLNGVLEVRKILTAEQFKKMHEKMKSKHEKRGGPWAGHEGHNSDE